MKDKMLTSSDLVFDPKVSFLSRELFKDAEAFVLLIFCNVLLFKSTGKFLLLDAFILISSVFSDMRSDVLREFMIYVFYPLTKFSVLYFFLSFIYYESTESNFCRVSHGLSLRYFSSFNLKDSLFSYSTFCLILLVSISSEH